MYTRLSERLRVTDHVAVLNIMLQKIAVNLKVFASCEDVISHTLTLFQVLKWTKPVFRSAKSAPQSVVRPCSTIARNSLHYPPIGPAIVARAVKRCVLLGPRVTWLTVCQHLCRTGERLNERQAAEVVNFVRQHRHFIHLSILISNVSVTSL